ncbi:MAG: response regulator [Deltaproteobacteria bacterium]|nr:response regulator [Deltaproteobacteria bacterium]
MKKKILVVDDNQQVLEFMAHLLEEEGHEVLTAEDGFSALNKLTDFTPDVMFVDLVMPHIGGDKLCKIVRKMKHLENCYLVLVTAAAAELEFDETEINADTCIAKGPFGSIVEHVLTAIKEADSRRRDDRLKKIVGLDDLHPRRMTRELLSRNRHLETILESITEGILETYHGKVVYANSAAVSLFGMKPEKLLSSTPADLFNEDVRPQVEKRLKKPSHIPSDIDPDTPVMLNDRQVILKHRAVKGAATTGIIMITDVTDRKQSEKELAEYRDHLEALVKARTAELTRTNEMLQHAQKMEAIGLLAGGVAHDLNNILSGLVSYPDLLLMDLPQDSPLRKPILTIQKSGEKAAGIVNDLLTLARRGVATTDVIRLNDVVSEYLKSPEYGKLRSDHPNVEVITDLDSNLLNIAGSQAHLSVTLMHLTANASESMPLGGKIRICTENRYIDRPFSDSEDVREGDYAVLTVADTGTGISPEDLKRIFEPFYTKKVMGRSGTGLGMAVVWGTVQDHMGYIDIRSTVGKGTVFTLFFPVTRQEVSDVSALISLEEYLGNGEAILVVDDVAEQREVACEILKRLNYRVTSVSGGKAAIEYLKTHTADLVILDMIMDPGIDGLETYKRILEIRPSQRAIIASGFSESERVRAAQKLGAGSYVKKPYLLETMGKAIRSELN